MAITGISTKSNLCTVCKKDPSPPIDIISSVFSSICSLTSKSEFNNFSTNIFLVSIDLSKLLYAIVIVLFIIYSFLNFIKTFIINFIQISFNK